MASIQGLVKTIRQNESNGMWSVKVGEDWVGAGKYKPKFSEGDEVAFEYTENGKYKNLVFNSVKVLETAPPAAMTEAKSSGGTDWDAKDKRITFLACRKDAIELAKMAIQTDSLTMPTKKADRLDTLVEFVNTLSNDLYNDIYNEDFLENVAPDSE